MLKKYHHNPAHLLVDNTTYFITAAIYEKRPLIKEPDVKDMLLNHIQNNFKRYNWELNHWVILDNHYHLIGKSRNGKDLSNIFRNIHSTSSVEIVNKTRCKKPVWWNYWDYCPRDEKEYIIRLNYLLFNPVKHGYTNNLNLYLFSSFHRLISEMGRDTLLERFRLYPEYKTLILREANKDDF